MDVWLACFDCGGCFRATCLPCTLVYYPRPRLPVVARGQTCMLYASLTTPPFCRWRRSLATRTDASFCWRSCVASRMLLLASFRLLLSACFVLAISNCCCFRAVLHCVASYSGRCGDQWPRRGGADRSDGCSGAEATGLCQIHRAGRPSGSAPLVVPVT
jgi:hypothetical protein